METKKCPSCGNELPISQFYKNAATKDGLQSYCKACLKAKRKLCLVAITHFGTSARAN